MAVVKSRRGESPVQFLETARASVVRMRRKLKTFREWVRVGKMTPFDAFASFQSWASGLRHANAYTSLNAMRRLFDGLFAGA